MSKDKQYMKVPVIGLLVIWISTGVASAWANNADCLEYIRKYRAKYVNNEHGEKYTHGERLAYLESNEGKSCTDNAYYVISKVDALFFLGRYDDAIQLLEEADRENLQPRSVILEKKISTLLLVKELDLIKINYSLDDLNALLIDALKIERQSADKSALPRLHYYLARVAYMKGKIDEAGVLLTEAISMGKDLPAKYYNFGAVIASKQKDWNTTARLFEIGLQKSKDEYLDSDETIRAVAEAFCHLGRNDLAAQAVTLALTENPVFANSHDIQAAQETVKNCPVASKKAEIDAK